MSQVRLLPRLSPVIAQSFLQELEVQKSPFQAPRPDYLQRGHERAAYAATGGTRDDESARALAYELRRLAIECGLGEKETGAKLQSQFDIAAAQHLALCECLQSGEALRDDVWTFIATILLPDVVAWRFPNRSANRYLGGVRNTFQRLWIRGTFLDRGEGHSDRWGLISALTEDAFVQIFERASIPASPGLARAIAEAWVGVAEQEGKGAMQTVARSAIKLVRIRNEIIDLSTLDENELRLELTSFFMDALSVKSGATSRRLLE